MQRDEYIQGINDMTDKLKAVLDQFDFWKYETPVMVDGKAQIKTFSRDFIIDEVKRELIQQRIKKKLNKARRRRIT